MKSKFHAPCTLIAILEVTICVKYSSAESDIRLVRRIRRRK